MSDQRLITNFEKELKKRVEIRTTAKLSAERILLDAFKYYDIKKAERVDFKTFKKVMTVKLGISLFNDEDMVLIFENYTKEDNTMFYREFISNLFGINVVLSVKTQPKSARDSRSFTNNKHDVVDQTAPVKKMIQFIRFKLRKGPMFSFLKLYKDIKEYDIQSTGTVSLNEFTFSLKKNNLDINGEDTKNIWLFFNRQGEGMQYELFMKDLCDNFNRDRRDQANEMFDKFNFLRSDRINIVMLKDLFNPKQHFNVKLGRDTIDQVQFQFEGVINTFAKLNGGHTIVDANQFVMLSQLISAHIESDQDFKAFVELCFRYNEIPKQNLSSYSRSDKHSMRESAQEDFPSMHSGLRVENILSTLEEQLLKKGYKAFIRFFEICKGHDYDHNGHLYLKHFEKCLKEARINITPKQTKKIYDAYTDDNIRMNYDVLFQNLVPPFKDDRIDYLKDLYGRLLDGEKEKHVTYHRFHSSFFVRGHPDFKMGTKHDYELKEEFSSALKTFLTCFQGNHMFIPPYTFIRFFEFYARNWTQDYFKNIVVYAFKTQKKSVYDNGPTRETKHNHQNQQSAFTKKKNNQNAQKYEEYINSVKYPNNPNMKTNKPYYVDESLVNTSEKNGDQKDTNQVPPERQPRDIQSRKESRLQNKSVSNRMKKSTKSNVKKVDDDLNQLLLSQNNPYTQNPNNVANIRKRLIDNIKGTGKIQTILDIEYAMTNKSDMDGNIGVTEFASVLSLFNVLKGISENQMSILYRQHMDDSGKLHVQSFCNEVRGQMEEDREERTIDLFERITPQHLDELPISMFRDAFNPNGFQFPGYKDKAQKLEMFKEVVDLFACLNVSIKDKDELDLDDFLYLFDNFSYLYESNKDYEDFLKNSFK